MRKDELFLKRLKAEIFSELEQISKKFCRLIEGNSSK